MDGFIVACATCGHFAFISQLLTYWNEKDLDEQDQALLARLPAAVRRRNDAAKNVFLNFDNWRGIAGGVMTGDQGQALISVNPLIHAHLLPKVAVTDLGPGPKKPQARAWGTVS